MAAPFTVLIVGCGNIAGGFDADRPPDALPLTHAGAFTRNPGFRLAACIEPDAQRRSAFMQRWAVSEGAGDFAALGAAARRFDVISLCSPTPLHGAHLAAALDLQPRLIFCEKPLTPSLQESEACVQRCADAGVLLAVNHTRRWAPDVALLREQLAQGELGPVRAVVAHYNKGLLNNGSHMFDLLRNLFGRLEPVRVGRAVYDHWPDDPSVSAELVTEGGVPVHLVASNAADYALFELEIIAARAVLTMEAGGARWRARQVVDNATFKSYKTLDSGTQLPGEYDQAMTRAVANIHGALTRGDALACTGECALHAQRLCARLLGAVHDAAGT